MYQKVHKRLKLSHIQSLIHSHTHTRLHTTRIKMKLTAGKHGQCAWRSCAQSRSRWASSGRASGGPLGFSSRPSASWHLFCLYFSTSTKKEIDKSCLCSTVYVYILVQCTNLYIRQSLYKYFSLWTARVRVSCVSCPEAGRPRGFIGRRGPRLVGSPPRPPANRSASPGGPRVRELWSARRLSGREPPVVFDKMMVREGERERRLKRWSTTTRT